MLLFRARYLMQTATPIYTGHFFSKRSRFFQKDGNRILETWCNLNSCPVHISMRVNLHVLPGWEGGAVVCGLELLGPSSGLEAAVSSTLLILSTGTRGTPILPLLTTIKS